MACLIYPCAQYLDSYMDACREFKACGLHLKSFHDPDAFAHWKDAIFTAYENDRLGINLKPGYVPSTMFWLVEDGAFIGEGSVRHRLTPPLERYGGHIGYAIRRSRWNGGYGTLQLSLLLREAHKLGIMRALVTCDEGNIASARVMEKNGGVYQDTVDNIVDGAPVRTKRYWIDTAPHLNTK